MKKIILFFILCTLIVPPLSFSEDDGYDTDLFDIPDDVVTESETSETVEEETWSLYGYIINYFVMDFIFSGDEFDTTYAGNVSYVRLKGDWRPHELLSFHAEISYDARLGNQNPYMLMEHYGILPPGYQDNFPGEDFVQTVNFDHFYGKMSFLKADIQFGKLPIAWGTGYAFNPTQKVTSLPFMDTIAEETPGTYGIIPSVSIMSGLSLEGYIAFQDKSHKTTSVQEDGEWEHIPWGVKMLGIIGPFDLSVSWIKEVLYTYSLTVPGEFEHRQSHYIGTDFSGGIGDIGLYGEGTLYLPPNEDETGFDFHGHEFKDLVEFVCGFYYTIPVIEVDVRGEYYHQGIGTTDTGEYSLTSVLSGEKVLQGEDYLFLFLDKGFRNYYTISLASFININDRSFALIPVISYDMYDNFQVELGSTLFFGEPGTEFSGEYDIDPLPGSELIVDIIQPMVYLKCKLSF